MYEYVASFREECHIISTHVGEHPPRAQVCALTCAKRAKKNTTQYNESITTWKAHRLYKIIRQFVARKFLHRDKNVRNAWNALQFSQLRGLVEMGEGKTVRGIRASHWRSMPLSCRRVSTRAKYSHTDARNALNDLPSFFHKISSDTTNRRTAF